MAITLNGSTGITTPALTSTSGVSGPVTATTGSFSGLISANGGQIAFPATQNPSSDANTLDDYEEGTFTPYFTGSTTNPTVVSYGSQTGKYVKIGKLVWVGVNIHTTNISAAGSGNLFISGLPFTSDNNLQEVGAAIGNSAYWNTYIPQLAGVLINDTRIELLRSPNANSQCSDLNTGVTSANYIRFQAVYLANA